MLPPDMAGGGGFALEDVLKTETLRRRPSRERDLEGENQALATLAQELAAHPENLLQKLVEQVLHYCRAGSAGVSIIEPSTDQAAAPGETVFRWRAIAGAFAENVGGSLPRDFSPCGMVIDRDAVLLFDRPARCFRRLDDCTPPIHEALLAPFYLDGRPIGTVWALSHRPEHQFDAEDARLLESLTRFASAGYQMEARVEQRMAELKETNAALEQEVTGRKRVEQALRDAKQLAEDTIDTVREPMLVLDFELRVQSANAAFYRTFHVAPEQTVGQDVFDLGNGQWDIPRLRELLEDVLPTNRVFNDFEVDHAFETIGRRVMLLNARRIDHVQLVLLAIEDITERKRAEEALQAAHAEVQHQASRLRQLTAELTRTEHRERKRLAALLHDHLQQLLVAVRMHLSRMQNDEIADATAQAVAQTVALVDEAVEASRDLTYQLRPPVLYEAGLVPALEWLGSYVSQHYQVEVRVEVEGMDETETGPDDDMKMLLFECVRELLFNAAKYARTDQATVALRQDESSLEVLVSDEGEGFDAASLQSRVGMDGFGLFSIRERLAAIGGEMEIDSRPGDGTRVRLQVPVQRRQAERPPAASAEGESGESPGGDNHTLVRVLVVDDHQIVRQAVAATLAGDGRLVIREAADGEQALRAIEHERPDVVLLDVNMPRMNGVETTRHIKQRWPSVVVVGLSVQDDGATVAAMREAGAAGFVSKASSFDRMTDGILQAGGLR